MRKTPLKEVSQHGAYGRNREAPKGEGSSTQSHKAGGGGWKSSKEIRERNPAKEALQSCRPRRAGGL